MASSPTTNLRLIKQGASDNEGTWGLLLNSGVMDVVDMAVAGRTAISTTGGTTTLSDADYTADQAKAAVLEITGTLVSNATTVIPNRAKTYIVDNGTSGAFSLTIKTSGGSGITVPQGYVQALRCDGVATGTMTYISAPVTPSQARILATQTVSVAATDRLLGRDTASGGLVEEISLNATLEFTGAGAIQRAALTGDVTAAAGSNAATIPNDTVTFAKMQNVATDSLVGRDTAGTGDPETILLNATLEMDGVGNLRRAALTGDVTAAAGSNSTTIPNDTVDNARLANMAEATLKGRAAGAGTGDPTDLTATQAKTALAITQADVAGLTTADSPQFAGLNIGHATDTTLTRAVAGDLNVEGNLIYRAGGTDVPIADGGTGASTAGGAATNLGLGTGDSPQFTAVNIGHATDTTVARVSAGDISVEGNLLYRAGGTDVPVTDGGTGRSDATAYAVICGGTTATGAHQSIAGVGTSGQVLTSNGAAALPTFQSVAGTGDVVGPASATDNAIVRFDGTTGKLVQNSAVTIADTTGVTTGMVLPNTGLNVQDTNASHNLGIVPGSDLTANRTLTLTTGDASRTLNLSGNATIGVGPTVQVFTASGTWTKPAGCIRVRVMVIGAGGGGGGADGGSSQSGAGGGGGGGGGSIEWIDVTGVSSESVTIGTGGSGGAAGNNAGSAGGTSSFGTVAYLQATGGAGGLSFAASSGNNFCGGSAGGVGSNGSWNFKGDAGGGAFTNGGNLPFAGAGGGSFMGGGGEMPNSTSSVGTNGYAYGGGGSGGTANTTTDRAGGNGADGIVVVEEYYA